MNDTATRKSCPDGQKDYSGVCLPKVDFETFVYSLFTTAMLHLGEVPDPDTGTASMNLPFAKHAIDTLAMLEEKTKGNLTDGEAKELGEFLGHLRLLYVKKTG